MDKARIALLVAAFITGCNKSGYRPDERQVDCRTFYDIREVWTDSAIGYQRSDTFNILQVCGANEIAKAKKDTGWLRICNVPNGETIYWIHFNPVIK